MPTVSTTIKPDINVTDILNVSGEVKEITNSDAFSQLETFVLFVCAIGFVDRLIVNCRNILQSKRDVKHEKWVENVQRNVLSVGCQCNKTDTKEDSSQTEAKQSSAGTQTENRSFRDAHSQTTIENFDALKRKTTDFVRCQQLVNSQSDTIRVLRRCLLTTTFNTQSSEVADADFNPACGDTQKRARLGAAQLIRMKRSIRKADSEIDVLKALREGNSADAQMEMIRSAEEELRTFSTKVHAEIDQLVDSLENRDKPMKVGFVYSCLSSRS